MNKISKTSQARQYICVTAIALVSLWSQLVWGDTRQYAISELDRLHQIAYPRTIDDEVKSANSTFALAEHYFNSKDFARSENFYLLTIQKVRIILLSQPKKPVNPNISSLTSQPYSSSINITTRPPLTSEVKVGKQKISGHADKSSTSLGGFHDTIPSPQKQHAEFLPECVSSENIVGTSSIYTVIKGDNIRLISAKLGVSSQYLIKNNKLSQNSYLKIGQKLCYNNRKIVPQRMLNGIIVNIPDRTLYFFKQGKLAFSLPVALGSPLKSYKYDWKTPIGKFKVKAKMKDPTWHVPASIQSEMENQGNEIITNIPPGPANPLGKYAIITSLPGILIHSTIKPSSIYSFASHGCIRVNPDQMEEFFKEVAINTPGEIIYKPVKLAITTKGRVFLEVNRDVYGNSLDGLAMEARRQIEKKNLSARVDWQKVKLIVRRSSGIAEDISL